MQMDTPLAQSTQIADSGVIKLDETLTGSQQPPSQIKEDELALDASQNQQESDEFFVDDSQVNGGGDDEANGDEANDNAENDDNNNENIDYSNNDNDENSDGQTNKRHATDNQNNQDSFQKRQKTGMNNAIAGNRNFNRKEGNGVELRILLPSKDAGAIIGRGGANIKKLRQEHKTQIQVPDCNGPERLLLINGDIDLCIKSLLDIIPLVEDNQKFNNNEGGATELRLLVHQSQAGCIIGRGGDKIKDLRIKHNLDMKVYSECAPMSTERVCQMKGKSPDIVSCLREAVGLLETAPPKGMSRPYDPHNFDEFLASQYGGFCSDKRQGGMQGGRGGQQGGGGGDRQFQPRNNYGNNDGGGGGRGGFQRHNSGDGGFNNGGGFNSRGGYGDRGGRGGFGDRGGRGGGGDRGGGRGGFVDRGGRGGGFGDRGGRGGGGDRGGGRGGFVDRGGRGGGFGGGDRGGRGGFGGGDRGGRGGYNNNNGNGQQQQQPSYGGSGGHQGGGSGPVSGTPGSTNQVTIPNELAGAVIGPKGAKIQQIRDQSGAGITIDKPTPGSNDRIITIQGNAEQIQNAQYLLQVTVKQSGLWQGQ